jgi:hypothetical protein
VDHHLQQRLSTLEFNEETSLSSVDDLVDVFTDAPARKHLNIVVKPRVGESQYAQIVCRALIVIPLVPPSVLPLRPLPDHRILELNCYVFGDESSQVFSVDIANTRPASALKDAIRDENPEAFRNVDARSLVVRKVSIPVNDGLKENARQVELRDKEALSPVDPLSDVFVDTPARRHVHIIVRSPNTDECEWQSSFSCGHSQLILAQQPLVRVDVYRRFPCFNHAL